jgi:hypothetical protein
VTADPSEAQTETMRSPLTVVVIESSVGVVVPARFLATVKMSGAPVARPVHSEMPAERNAPLAAQVAVTLFAA